MSNAGQQNGVIYAISRRGIEELDILESIPSGLYKQETFLVLGEDGAWHQADLYRVATPTGPYPPAPSYLDLMIEGAREHDLDAAYTARLIQLRRDPG